MDQGILIPEKGVKMLLKMAQDMDLDYPHNKDWDVLIPIEHSDFVRLFRSLFRWACNRHSYGMGCRTSLSTSMYTIFQEVGRTPPLEEILNSPTLHIFAQLAEGMIETLKTKSLDSTYCNLSKIYLEEHKGEKKEVFIPVLMENATYYGVSQFLTSFFRKNMPEPSDLPKFLRCAEAITAFENGMQEVITERPFMKRVISIAFLTAVNEEFELISGNLGLSNVNTLTLIETLQP